MRCNRHYTTHSREQSNLFKMTLFDFLTLTTCTEILKWDCEKRIQSYRRAVIFHGVQFSCILGEFAKFIVKKIMFSTIWFGERLSSRNLKSRKLYSTEKNCPTGIVIISVAHCVCTYIFLRFFGLLGPGNNGCVKVSDRDSKKRSGRSEIGRWNERWMLYLCHTDA